MLHEKKVVPTLRQEVKVKVDIVTSDDIKIYYTWKFQDFTARYTINIQFMAKRIKLSYEIGPTFSLKFRYRFLVIMLHVGILFAHVSLVLSFSIRLEVKNKRAMMALYRSTG